MQLYNGNISTTTLSLSKISNGALTGYSYQYDQLNRIVKMNQHTGIAFNAGSWSNSSIVQDYKEEIAYDANGNILRYLRNGTSSGGGLSMDSLTYHYTAGTNKLDHVRDAIGDASYTVDIDNQSSGNYEYDAIGNLVKDTKEGISNIEWTVYGKINSITKTNGTSISYAYDAAGNRVQKTVVATGAGTKNTFYVRDAQGNVMGVYADSSSTGLTLNEQHVYGSSRLGLYNWGKAIAANAPVPQWQGGSNYTPVYDSILPGSISFELSNHLGNVLSTISDKKIGIPLNDTVVNSYIAEVLSQNDYYPFGMMMPGRTYTAGSSYRYGFNGKENDNEVKGEGNQQDYGMRIYDTRLGKFLSVDPITNSYPFYTPYQYAGNTPIQATDLDGGEPDAITWRLAVLWFKLTLDNLSSDNISNQISDVNRSANNNYGRFDNNRDIGEQVRENQKKTIESKAKVVGKFAKGAAISSAIVATPYVIAAGTAVLPELFAIVGPKAQAFLVQGTVKAFVNASAQQVASGKVDWADVALEYLPFKGKFGDAIKGAIEASVDFSGGEFESVFDGKKNLSEAAIDALAIGFTNKMFGRFNETLENTFKAQGLKGDKLIAAMGAVLKSQTEFLKEAIETSLSEVANKKLKEKK